MANPMKGEATLKAGGREFTLAFNINALCEVEYLLDRSTEQILRALVLDPPLHVVRALLWGGLRQHHPDLDLKAVGEIMEDLGGTEGALDAMGDALTAAFPEAKGGEPDRPRKGAPAGPGRRSLKRGSP